MTKMKITFTFSTILNQNEIRLKTGGSRIACFTTKLLSRNYNPRYKKITPPAPEKKLENLPKDCTTKQRNQKKLLHTTKTNV